MSSQRNIDKNPFVNDLQSQLPSSAPSSNQPSSASPNSFYKTVPPPATPSAPNQTVVVNTATSNSESAKSAKASAKKGEKFDGILGFLCKWMWVFCLTQLICCCGNTTLPLFINTIIAVVAFIMYRKENYSLAKKLIIFCVIAFIVVPMAFSLFQLIKDGVESLKTSLIPGYSLYKTVTGWFK